MDLSVEQIRHHGPSLCLLCTKPSSLTVIDSSSTAVAPVYKYKAVSFKNLFHFNHLIHLVRGCIQKPPSASADSFEVDCARATL